MKRGGFRQKAYPDALAGAVERRAGSVFNSLSRTPATSGASTVRRSTLRRKPVTPEEKEWRARILERDDCTCQWPGCGYRSELNHAHHINERSQRPDLELDLSNGTTLCGIEGNNHHDYTHHDPVGRAKAREYGILGGDTYEKASKQ